MFAAATAQGLGDMKDVAAAESEGALTPAQEEALYTDGIIPPVASGNPAVDQLAEITSGVQPVVQPAADLGEGHKFPLPEKPFPWHTKMQQRYHPLLMQFARLLMKDGKLSQAQYVGWPPNNRFVLSPSKNDIQGRN